MASTGKSTVTAPRLKKAKVVIVRTEWNKAVVDSLFEGCKKVLGASDVSFVDILVPGAFEIPFSNDRSKRRSELRESIYELSMRNLYIYPAEEQNKR